MPIEVALSRREVPVFFKDAAGVPSRIGVLKELGSIEHSAYVQEQFEMREIPAVVVDGVEKEPARQGMFYKDPLTASLEMIRRCLHFEKNPSPPESVAAVVAESKANPSQADEILLRFYRESTADPARGNGERPAYLEEVAVLPYSTVKAIGGEIDRWEAAVSDAAKNP